MHLQQHSKGLPGFSGTPLTITPFLKPSLRKKAIELLRGEALSLAEFRRREATDAVDMDRDRTGRQSNRGAGTPAG